MQQRIHTQVCRLNRGSLSWTELQLGNCKLQEKNKIRKPRALLQSGPTSQLTYSLRGEYIFQSPWAINLNTPRYSTKDMKRERAPWTKEERLPCSVQPQRTWSASLRVSLTADLPCSWDWGPRYPLLTPDNVALLIRVSVTHVQQQEGAVRVRLVFTTGLFSFY